MANTPAVATQNTAVATYDNSPSSRIMTLAGQVQDMADAHQLAQQFAKTSFAGPFKGKVDDLAVAILKGNSLGIPAHEVGGKIYAVHGTPALYGKTGLAIAKAHGYKFERVEYGPKQVTVKATAPDGDVDSVTYSYERAEREGLVKGNAAQYKTRPEKMLFWKCVGELADQFFPHLLAGMPIKEDWEQSESIKATAERIQPAPESTPDLTAAIEAASEEKTSPEDALSTVLAVIDGTSDSEEIDGLTDFIKAHLDQYPDTRDEVVKAWQGKKQELS